MHAIRLGICFTLTLSAFVTSSGTSRRSPNTPSGWNAQAAAAYLDRREAWWMAWPPARRDHATFCVSCHTAVPYALARPLLHAALGEQEASPAERRLTANVVERVRLWESVDPYYGGAKNSSAKAIESRATEAVLNAFMLSHRDARAERLTSEARLAFDHMWELQKSSGSEAGAWPWLNFGNEPWEAGDSQYYGAALAAIAVGNAPGGYAQTPSIRNNLKQLRQYLLANRTHQSLINRCVFLWASAKLPELVSLPVRESAIQELLDAQQADGGWSLSFLAWNRHASSLSSALKLWVRSENTPFHQKSDGYATDLVLFTLEQCGFPQDGQRFQHGLAWLLSHQDPVEGSWPGYSLNTRHDPSSGTGHFMRDAATAYAVLALTEARPH